MPASSAIFRALVATFLLSFSLVATAQESQPATRPAPPASADSASSEKPPSQWSGMYEFVKEGEFVQLTVEDQAHVTGFISRYDESGGKDKEGAFLDQYFKSAKLDGNKLSFATEVAQGVSFDFKGTVERGAGQNPGDEAYFVLKGTLSKNTTDATKKVSASSREVTLNMFPQEAVAGPAQNPSPKN